ncbi:60S ribosomal protein L19-2 [Dendrobium catenatum]|uniref:60S ribosomal protein L19-2 n=1 Tax=Dendrobium catenatum TaxID=906689 RepID=A0A2I0VVV7_9ASPA|nr:60S ribosomal protein L19-2 [Dendrobium catenatum]PKU86851.1 60S ribosomal protein L19-2 [Dendrobium catenatum]
MAASLKLHKRLAASLLNCGKGKIWLDPKELNHISFANSRQNIRKLVHEGFIIKKPEKIHSRSRSRRFAEAKRKGRHSGYGKRKGTMEARLPTKVLWMRKMRVLRRLLKKYRENNKIDKHVYHDMYVKVKGNVFKNKRVLVETIFKFTTGKTMKTGGFFRRPPDGAVRPPVTYRRLTAVIAVGITDGLNRRASIVEPPVTVGKPPVFTGGLIITPAAISYPSGIVVSGGQTAG